MGGHCAVVFRLFPRKPIGERDEGSCGQYSDCQSANCDNRSFYDNRFCCTYNNDSVADSHSFIDGNYQPDSHVAESNADHVANGDHNFAH